jgi:hypothetical protein
MKICVRIISYHVLQGLHYNFFMHPRAVRLNFIEIGKVRLQVSAQEEGQSFNKETLLFATIFVSLYISMISVIKHYRYMMSYIHQLRIDIFEYTYIYQQLIDLSLCIKNTYTNINVFLYSHI